jgi:hypothetical protein
MVVALAIPKMKLDFQIGIPKYQLEFQFLFGKTEVLIIIGHEEKNEVYSYYSSSLNFSRS